MDLINKSNWNIIKGKLKENYGDLTDNDLAIAEGKEDQVLGNLQKKLGKTKADFMDELSSYLNKSQ